MVATTRTVIAASELRALVAAHYDLGAEMRLGHRALEVDFTGDMWRVNGYWESALHTLRAWATAASL